MASKGIFIDRQTIKQTLDSIASNQCVVFSSEELRAVGNAVRYCFVADGKKAMLNLYYNKDGTTTITPTGQNQEISSALKKLVENTSHKKADITATYTFKNVPQQWLEKLVEYLSSLDNVSFTAKKHETLPSHISYQFISNLGDKLTVNVYDNKTLTLQGKPAYLYGEAISLLSYCSSISFNQIVETSNAFHGMDIKPSVVRDDIKGFMPNAYNNIDDTIIKILSPSVLLKKVSCELEDYSCYAFPALRALEGYIKYIFGLKSISVGHTFHGIFNNGTLIAGISQTINNIVIQGQLERLYDFFCSNRHVLFHTDAVLIGTTILTDKHEADMIVNQVLYLIEDSYVIIKNEI